MIKANAKLFGAIGTFTELVRTALDKLISKTLELLGNSLNDLDSIAHFKSVDVAGCVDW